MIIINKNEGDKIPYSIRGNKITIDDELMLNLEKYERDDPNHIDICRDKFDNKGYARLLEEITLS